MNKIGQQVRKYRKNLGLTQEELAEDICNRSYISQLEKGYSIPTPEILEKIADRLNVNVKDLCTDFDSSDQDKIGVQNKVRYIISSIEENNWERAQKWLFSLSQNVNILDSAEKCIYEWGKGVLAQLDQHFDQAESHFLASINYGRMVNQDLDPFLLVRPLISLGEHYSMTENAMKAVSFLDEAKQLVIKYDISGLTRVSLYYSLGYMHMKLGEYYSGIRQYEQAETLNQSYGSFYKSGQIYMGLAVCYQHLRRFDQAEKINWNALALLKLYTDSKRDVRIAGIYNNLGMIYRSTKRYDLAIENLEKAIFIHQKMGNNHWFNNSKLELAKVYNLIGRYDEAKEICQSVIECPTTEHILAEANLTLSESLCNSKEWEIALQAVEKAIMYFKESNSKYFVRAQDILTRISFKAHENQDVKEIYHKYLVGAF